MAVDALRCYEIRRKGVVFFSVFSLISKCFHSEKYYWDGGRFISQKLFIPLTNMNLRTLKGLAIRVESSS